MISQFLLALGLIFPFVISGALHMFAVKKNHLPVMKKPLSVRWFGENKTYRGFILMPLFTVLGVLFSLWIPIFSERLDRFEDVLQLGAGLGFFYALFELPNSFVKRRLGIPPGKNPSQFAFLFAFIDQADSVVGGVLFYKIFWSDLSLMTLVLVLFLGPAIHLLVNYVLYRLKLRKEAM